jgi:hypothetical protein
MEKRWTGRLKGFPRAVKKRAAAASAAASVSKHVDARPACRASALR